MAKEIKRLVQITGKDSNRAANPAFLELNQDNVATDNYTFESFELPSSASALDIFPRGFAAGTKLEVVISLEYDSNSDNKTCSIEPDSAYAGSGSLPENARNIWAGTITTSLEITVNGNKAVTFQMMAYEVTS